MRWPVVLPDPVPRIAFALILVSLIAVAQARAADEPAEKAKSGNKVTRALDRTGKAITDTAKKVERKVGKAATATGKAIESAGKKTDQWIKKKME